VRLDLRHAGLRAAGPTLHRFWTMIAHSGIWNAADPARALNLTYTDFRGHDRLK
jgi:hypothetical protein